MRLFVAFFCGYFLCVPVKINCVLNFSCTMFFLEQTHPLVYCIVLNTDIEVLYECRNMIEIPL